MKRIKMHPSFTTSYEMFVPTPGVTTYAVAFIVISLVLWAKRRDERDAEQAMQDNEDPHPSE